jgi:hypothetical protein
LRVSVFPRGRPIFAIVHEILQSLTFLRLEASVGGGNSTTEEF